MYCRYSVHDILSLKSLVYIAIFINALFILVLKQWFFKIYLYCGGKNASENREGGKRERKIGRKQTPEQESIRIYKQSCCVGKSYMEERVEVFWRVFGKVREEK